MNDGQPTAEALAVKGALILAVGSRDEIEKAHKGPNSDAISRTRLAIGASDRVTPLPARI
jgi:hypothetical protein